MKAQAAAERDHNIPRKTSVHECLHAMRDKGAMSVTRDGFKYTYTGSLKQLLCVIVSHGSFKIAYNVIPGGKNASGKDVDFMHMLTIYRHAYYENGDGLVGGGNRVGYIEPRLPAKAMFAAFVKAIQKDVQEQLRLLKAQPWNSYFEDVNEVEAAAEPVPDSKRADDLASAYARVRSAILKGKGFGEVRTGNMVIETLAEAGGPQLVFLVHKTDGTYVGCAHARILDYMKGTSSEFQILINDRHPWLDVEVPSQISQAGLLKIMYGFIVDKFKSKINTVHGAAEAEPNQNVFESCQDFMHELARSGVLKFKGFSLEAKLDGTLKVSRDDAHLLYDVVRTSSTNPAFSVRRLHLGRVYGGAVFPLGHFLPELPLKLALRNMLRIMLPDVEKQFQAHDRGLGYTTDVRAAAEVESRKNLDPDTVRNILLQQLWIHAVSMYTLNVRGDVSCVRIMVAGSSSDADMAVVSVSVCETIVYLKAGVAKSDLSAAAATARECARICDASAEAGDTWDAVWDKIVKFREKYVRGGARPLNAGVINRARHIWTSAVSGDL